MALTIVLGNKNYSSWSLRPWLALKHAGAAFEEIVVPLDRPDSRAAILRQSPSGRVPALRDGELTVWDSLAICEYLAERFPDAALWPAEREARAVARSISAEMHSGFPNLRNSMPMNLRRPPAPPRKPPLAGTDDEIARIREIWRTCRARWDATGAFLFGAPTIADYFFAPVVTRFSTYAVALDGPEAEYAEAVRALPAMQEWRAAALAEVEDMGRYAGY